MAHTAKNTSGNLYQTSRPLYKQLTQAYEIRGQLGLCWCLQYPSGENISKAVRSIVE